MKFFQCKCCSHRFAEIGGEGRHQCPQCKVRFVGGKGADYLTERVLETVFRGVSPLTPFNDWRVGNVANQFPKPNAKSWFHNGWPAMQAASAMLNCKDAKPIFAGFDPGLGESWSNWGTYKVETPKVKFGPSPDELEITWQPSASNRMACPSCRTKQVRQESDWKFCPYCNAKWINTSTGPIYQIPRADLTTGRLGQPDYSHLPPAEYVGKMVNDGNRRRESRKREISNLWLAVGFGVAIGLVAGGFLGCLFV